MNKGMLFVFVTLWTAAFILLFTDFKSVSARWASSTAFCGGAGGLAVVIEETMQPFLKERFDSEIIDEIARISDIVFSSVSHYFTPYTFLMFAITYSGLFNKQISRLFALHLLIPPLLMYFIYPLYPELVIPYPIASLWVTPYILFGVGCLIYSFLREDNPYVRLNRLYTNLAFIPAVLFGLATNFLLRSIGIDDSWRYNSWIIAFSFGIFVISIFKFGFVEVQLSIQRRKLNHAMRTVSSGTAFLNHALKNDLGKIKLFGEKIKFFAVDSGQKDLEEDIRVILDSYQRIQSLMIKIQNQIKESDLTLYENSLINIIENCLRQLKPKLKDIQIDRKYRNDVKFLSDRSQLEEAIYNVLLNAVEAMPSGGELSIKIFETKRKIVTVIKDTGIGIPKENLSRILDPFFSTKADSERNFGLGLSYCYNVIKKHGGSLEFNSKLNVGTTVNMIFKKRKF